jgi:polyhydroxyalkanoate synthesis regulator phasin
MAAKMTEEEARQYVRNVLGGKKNAAGKGTTGGIRSSLVSALKRGNTTARNEILGKYAVAHGAPAAAAAAAGVAVANAVAPNKTAKITTANRKAAKNALNAALGVAGSTKKAGIAAASKYAKLLKEGKASNAKAYMDNVIEAAAEKGAEAAAKAAAKVAEKEAKVAAKAAGPTSAEIKARLVAAAAPAGVVNIAIYRKAKLAGASNSAAIAVVKQSRKNAGVKSAVTRKLKKNGAPAAVAAPAAAVAALAGKKNMATNTRNLELLMGGPRRPASA